MFDGLLWKAIEQKPVWDRDGFMNWLVIERHRIYGNYRTVRVDEKWDETHARNFTSNQQTGATSGGGE
jgi:hypothetical protein